MAISVEIKFLGIFQRLSGKKSLKMELDESATVEDIVLNLMETFSSEFKETLVDSKLDNTKPNALLLIEGKEISALQGLKTRVKDSDEIVLIPIVHGG